MANGIKINKLHTTLVRKEIQMDKKTYVLQVLRMLEKSWPIAKPLITLVEGDVLDNDGIAALVKVMSHALEAVSDATQRQKIEKGIEVLETIQKQEAESREEEKKELDELEKMMDDLEDETS